MLLLDFSSYGMSPPSVISLSSNSWNWEASSQLPWITFGPLALSLIPAAEIETLPKTAFLHGRFHASRLIAQAKEEKIITSPEQRVQFRASSCKIGLWNWTWEENMFFWASLNWVWKTLHRKRKSLAGSKNNGPTKGRLRKRPVGTERGNQGNWKLLMGHRRHTD